MSDVTPPVAPPTFRVDPLKLRLLMALVIREMKQMKFGFYLQKAKAKMVYVI